MMPAGFGGGPFHFGLGSVLPALIALGTLAEAAAGIVAGADAALPAADAALPVADADAVLPAADAALPVADADAAERHGGFADPALAGVGADAALAGADAAPAMDLALASRCNHSSLLKRSCMGATSPAHPQAACVQPKGDSFPIMRLRVAASANATPQQQFHNNADALSACTRHCCEFAAGL